jgi:S1-C subfamily serine protease
MAAIAKIRGKVQNIEDEMAREERQMINKVLIGVVALALVLAGAAGAYTFYLGEKLAASQKQQAAEISALRDETVALGEETQARIDTLNNELKGVALEMEQSLIDAGKLYQEVSQSIVRISDGEVVLGSGFAFDAAGHILTNQHVIEGQNPIYIITPDGHTSSATIIGACEYSDVAVLRQSLFLPALTLPALTLADSTTVKVGEPVIVIGSPFDLPGTLTSGIVSQTDRFAEVKYDTETRGVANTIQFDAAVNSGNSGSPLLNSKGEVIGMVIARIDPTLGDGVYYAVSSNKVKRVALSLIERGSFDYPWLGVEIANLTPETAIARNLETVNGVLVKTVIPATPAEAGGIKVDDIIVAINGTQVRDMADLTCYLGEYASYDEEVTLTLIRDGAQIELQLTVGKR